MPIHFSCVVILFFVPLDLELLILLIVLDPDTKMTHFKKHWDSELQGEVLKTAEEIVCFFPN